MKENIPPLSEWSFNRLNSLYELCGKSFRACGREVGCSNHTFKKYYDLAKKMDACAKEPGCGCNERSVVMPVTVSEVPNVIMLEKHKKCDTEKLITKSMSSDIFLDPKKSKVAIFDIETSDLDAAFGLCLTCSVKTFNTNEDVKTFYIDLNNVNLKTAEKILLQEINSCLSGYDCVCGFYSSKFDIPFLRTRSLCQGLQPIKKIKHLDFWFTAKRIICSKTRRLDRVNNILLMNKTGKNLKKTSIDIDHWSNVIQCRDKESLSYILDHNIRDVLILENAILEMKDFLPERIMRS